MHNPDNLESGYDLGHPMDMKVLIAVFVALLGLTALTVSVSHMDLGNLDLSIAMIIATVKALLVAVFFMHLIHDKGINVLVFIGSIICAGLFLAVTLGDTFQYGPDVTEFQQAQEAVSE